jgi:hypothetical protein
LDEIAQFESCVPQSDARHCSWEARKVTRWLVFSGPIVYRPAASAAAAKDKDRTPIPHALVTLRMALAVGLIVSVSGCGSNAPTSASGPGVTVTSVSVTGAPPIVGATAQLSATATLSNGTTQAVTTQAAWSSSNTSIATVTSSGILTGIAAGESDITATYQSVSGRSHVTIVRPEALTNTLSGTVTDGTSGGILPNINVQVTDSAGNVKSTLTGSSGAYSINGLAAGSATLAVSAISYQTSRLTVSVSADTRFDIVLQRTVCTFTLSPTTLSFRSTGGTGTVTVATTATGCAWTTRSNDAFMAITSGSSGLDNGTVTFSVNGNIATSRSGTLTIAGLTVTVTQDAGPAIVMAAYDPTFKTPVCADIGSGCDSDTLLNGSGSTESNQPNTIFSSCPDGVGTGHIALLQSIKVSTLDGGALAAGKSVRIDLSGGGSSANHVRIYVTGDAVHPSWTLVADSRQFPGGTFSVQTVLPTGSVQAVRVNYSFGGAFGPGPCATGVDDDNDDLVFRVQ